MSWPKGRKHSKKEKDKLRESVLKYYTPSVRKKISIIMKKRYSNPPARKKMSSALKKYYSNPPSRLKLSKARKKYLKENPEVIEKIDRTMTEWWKEHPHIRKERSMEMKNFFMKNPGKFKKFLKYGSNPSALSFKTRQGFLVRSRGEQKIANFLHNNKIKSEYESKTLVFKKEGQICVPDFWLPSSKTYIEFYGGHPKAWKKKVMKNKLYKKHKIKCVFITPAELRNLEYFLERELRKTTKKS